MSVEVRVNCDHRLVIRSTSVGGKGEAVLVNIIQGVEVSFCPECGLRLGMHESRYQPGAELAPDFATHNAAVMEAMRQGHNRIKPIAEHAEIDEGVATLVLMRLCEGGAIREVRLQDDRGQLGTFLLART